MPENIRILQCFDCKTMEELPDYQGDPVFDSILQTLDEKHGGQTQQPHARTLHVMRKDHWEDRGVRKQTVESMWSATTGFKPSYYDIKDTLKDDAVKCFNAHHRSIPCLDYEDSSKRLGNPAAQDRARLAREMKNDSLKHSAVRIYLCAFCPVQVTVDLAKRRAAGLE